MTRLAKDTGLAREALYRALSQDGNPEFATVLKVLKVLGLRLSTVEDQELARDRNAC
jgi:probable addiction module antidote protein